MPNLIASLIIGIIFAVLFWWVAGLAGDVVSDNKMSQMAEFGLLLFDALLAIVVLLLGIIGFFGYSILIDLVKKQARETVEKHLKTEGFKKEFQELVKKEMEDFTEEARHSLTKDLTRADEVSPPVAQTEEKNS